MTKLNVNALVVKHYTYHDHVVRALIQPNQTWFDAEDVCDLLGYSNVQQTIKQLNNEDCLKLNVWDVQKNIPILIHEVWGYHMQLNQYFINEFGVSLLLARHRWTVNDKGCHWLIHNIIPSVVPTTDPKANNRYRHHKRMLMKFNWHLIKRNVGSL